MTMPHLFGAEGIASLLATLARRPLLAFDFDGTLAPIVARPADARVPRGVAQRLAALNTRLPVAIVTGRTVADVRSRLDFEPRFIVGNHGAEDEGADPGQPGPALLTAALDPLRERLRQSAGPLAALGVVVEDKQLSIALHYRLAPDRERALAGIDELLAPLAGSLSRFGGKRVVNLAPRGAPDKFVAVKSLVARSGAGAAVFAGDDVNDEPVFASAPADWLTLKVGRDGPPSQARFCLDGPQEIATLLDRMLAALGEASDRG